MKPARLLAVLIACGVASACGSPEPASNPPATQPGAPPPTAGAGTMSGSEFGVPECDQYMKKYMACVDSKVPEAARATMRQSLEQTKAAWKQAAATPQGRDGLAMGCKQAEAMAKQSMGMYGCTW